MEWEFGMLILLLVEIFLVFELSEGGFDGQVEGEDDQGFNCEIIGCICVWMSVFLYVGMGYCCGGQFGQCSNIQKSLFYFGFLIIWIREKLVNGFVDGYKFGVVGKGCFDLNVVDYVGNVFYDLIVGQNFGIGGYQVGD